MTDQSTPAVNIVIPNFNGLAFLSACLTSIEEQQEASFQVTVVDNGSSDGSLEYLMAFHPLVRLVALPENRGFSAAVNAGKAVAAANSWPRQSGCNSVSLLRRKT
ncbi:MAG: glycosyltransferase [Candidatus Electrothrix sp. AR3]|nr:glycosyltransferase [Candidatus Electrothrix sp. AR3]